MSAPRIFINPKAFPQADVEDVGAFGRKLASDMNVLHVHETDDLELRERKSDHVNREMWKAFVEDLKTSGPGTMSDETPTVEIAWSKEFEFGPDKEPELEIVLHVHAGGKFSPEHERDYKQIMQVNVKTVVSTDTGTHRFVPSLNLHGEQYGTSVLVYRNGLSYPHPEDPSKRIQKGGQAVRCLRPLWVWRDTAGVVNNDDSPHKRLDVESATRVIDVMQFVGPVEDLESKGLVSVDLPETVAGNGASTLSNIPQSYTSKRAIIVAVDKYKYGVDVARGEAPPEGRLANLTSCNKDADALKDLLINRMGFAETRIDELRDEKATSAAIRNKLEHELPASLVDDGIELIVIAFSGHGDEGGFGQGYMLPHDADPQTMLLAGNGLNFRDIQGWAELLLKAKPLDKGKPRAAKHILMLFDCCMSGHAVLRTINSDSGNHRSVVEVITACTTSQAAAAVRGVGGLLISTMVKRLSQHEFAVELFGSQGIPVDSHFLMGWVSRDLITRKVPQRPLHRSIFNCGGDYGIHFRSDGSVAPTRGVATCITPTPNPRVRICSVLRLLLHYSDLKASFHRLVRMSGVCKSWRTAILSSQALWRDISLSSSTTVTNPGPLLTWVCRHAGQSMGKHRISSRSLSPSTIAECLKLSDMGIGDEGATAIGEALKCTTAIQSLDLSGDNISVEGARAIGEALKCTTAIQSLDLSDNGIGDEGASAIGEALMCTTAIQSLDISENHIFAAGARAIAEALKCTTTVQSLHLSRNLLGDKGASAIGEALKCTTAIKSLDLGYNAIGAEGARVIGEALKCTTAMQSLHLSGNHIGAEGASAIREALKCTAAIQSLDLSGNDIGAEGARAIGEGLKCTTAIQSLDLSGNCIFDKGARAIGEALKCTTAIQSLHLSHNYIGVEGAKAIGEALKCTAAIQSLDLSRNLLGDEGATAIAEALKCTTAIQSLDLCGSNIGDEGASAIGEALKCTTAIQSLDISQNHIFAAGARAIGEALMCNTAIQSLDLSDNRIGDEGASAIGEALMCTTAIQSLDLTGNYIGAAGARAIGEALKCTAAIQSLDLSDNDIFDEGARAIGEALKCTTAMQSLHLNRNYIGAVGARAIGEALKWNTAIKSLDLRYNRIDAKGARAIGEALMCTTAIQSLNLGCNCIGSAGARAIGEALKCTTAIQSLHLNSNFIGAEGATAIGEGLKCTTTIQSLDLSGNLLGDEGARAIGEALKCTTAIHSLDLSDNDIGAAGARAIGEALKCTTAIQSLDLSDNRIGSAGARAIGEALKCTTIKWLDISQNLIEELPVVFGRCRSLVTFKIGRDVGLQFPPPEITSRPLKDLLAFLRSAERGGRLPWWLLKVMIVGRERAGKTSVLRSLKAGRPMVVDRDHRTVGIDVHRWQPSTNSGLELIAFDFAGQQAYYASHQPFLSHRGLFLVVVQLVRDGVNGINHNCIEEALQWLSSIQVQTPGAAVMLVGTHVDLWPQNKTAGGDSQDILTPEGMLGKVADAWSGLSRDQNCNLDQRIEALEKSISPISRRAGSPWHEAHSSRRACLARFCDGSHTPADISEIGSWDAQLSSMERQHVDARDSDIADIDELERLRSLRRNRLRIVGKHCMSCVQSDGSIRVLEESIVKLATDQIHFPDVGRDVPLPFAVLEQMMWDARRASGGDSSAKESEHAVAVRDWHSAIAKASKGTSQAVAVASSAPYCSFKALQDTLQCLLGDVDRSKIHVNPSVSFDAQSAQEMLCVALRLFHDTGCMLWYEHVSELSDVVIIDPSFVLKASKFITCHDSTNHGEHGDEDVREVCRAIKARGGAAFLQDMPLLENQGVLTQRLLTQLFIEASRIIDKQTNRSILPEDTHERLQTLLLLPEWGILLPFGEDRFFVPARLPFEEQYICEWSPGAPGDVTFRCLFTFSPNSVPEGLLARLLARWCGQKPFPFANMIPIANGVEVICVDERVMVLVEGGKGFEHINRGRSWGHGDAIRVMGWSPSKANCDWSLFTKVQNDIRRVVSTFFRGVTMDEWVPCPDCIERGWEDMAIDKRTMWHVDDVQSQPQKHIVCVSGPASLRFLGSELLPVVTDGAQAGASGAGLEALLAAIGAVRVSNAATVSAAASPMTGVAGGGGISGGEGGILQAIRRKLMALQTKIEQAIVDDDDDTYAELMVKFKRWQQELDTLSSAKSGALP